MFFGRIDIQATVQEFEKRRDRYFLRVDGLWRDLQKDELLCVNGQALRVHECDEKSASFWLEPTVAEAKNFLDLQAGHKLPIERAPLLSERWNGHWVRGRPDTLGTLLNCLDVDGQIKVNIALAAEYGKYCIKGGTVTLNGLAMEIYNQQLTKQGEFLISAFVGKKMAANSNLLTLNMGARVNVELDIIARYVDRLINKERVLEDLVEGDTTNTAVQSN